MALQKNIQLIILLNAFTLCSHAQNLPIYNHYFNNPFFYNPSYSNSKKQAEINLLYRQQRISLGRTPTFSFLTLTAPLSKKVGVGLSVSNNERGVITTNSAQAAVSYKTQFGSQSYMSFGLSAGLGKDGLDLNQVDINDPVVARQLDKNFYLEGQAGVNFQLKKLNIGLSLPQFFDQFIVDANSFQHTKINPFNTSISSIRYPFKISKNLSLEPILMVKLTKGIHQQFELYGTARYKDIFWLGGLYRQNYGVAGITGVQISHVLQCGYSYEFPANQISQLISSTHEFNVSFKLGAKSSMDDPTNRDKTKSVPSDLKRKKRKSLH